MRLFIITLISCDQMDEAEKSGIFKIYCQVYNDLVPGPTFVLPGTLGKTKLWGPSVSHSSSSHKDPRNIEITV